jgi:hypothetical protein
MILDQATLMLALTFLRVGLEVTFSPSEFTLFKGALQLGARQYVADAVISSSRASDDLISRSV